VRVCVFACACVRMDREIILFMRITT